MMDLLLNCLKLLGGSIIVGITIVVIVCIITVLWLLIKATIEIMKN